MEFDGYRIPGRNNQDKDYAWYAVLVWSGMKPNPKYNAKLEHLNSNSYFQSGPSKLYPGLLRVFSSLLPPFKFSISSILSFFSEIKILMSLTW